MSWQEPARVSSSSALLILNWLELGLIKLNIVKERGKGMARRIERSMTLVLVLEVEPLGS